MEGIKLLLVDDHIMIREGVASMLRSNNDFKVLGEASNGKEALEFLENEKVKPDIVLMDINMPVMDGIACTKQITSHYSEIKVLVLTMIKQNTHIRKMLQAGASGYILKNSDRTELFESIYTIYGGESYFSRSVTNEVMNEMIRLKKTTNRNDVLLTKREKEILELIVNDFSNVQIAEKLKISTRTVESHKQNLLSKTGTKSIAGLVVYAIKHNLTLID